MVRRGRLFWVSIVTGWPERSGSCFSVYTDRSDHFSRERVIYRASYRQLNYSPLQHQILQISVNRNRSGSTVPTNLYTNPHTNLYTNLHTNQNDRPGGWIKFLLVPAYLIVSAKILGHGRPMTLQKHFILFERFQHQYCFCRRTGEENGRPCQPIIG